MKFPALKHCILGGTLIVLAAVCYAVFSSLGGILQSQLQAERWAGESGESFAQISCFLSPEDTLDMTGVAEVREKTDEKLAAASMTAQSGGSLRTDCWSASGKLTAVGPAGSVETDVLGVGGSYFDFHPMVLRSGSFLTADAIGTDRVCVDERLAWLLYGSVDLAGMTLTINGNEYTIVGVFAQESDRATGKVREAAPLLVMDYGTFSGLTSETISCYEIVLPDPVDSFALDLVTEVFPAKNGRIVQNTGRFSLSASWSRLISLADSAVQSDTAEIPYWENAARYLEVQGALLLAVCILLLVHPTVAAAVILVRAFVFLRKKAHVGFGTGKERFLDWTEARRIRKDSIGEGESTDGGSEDATLPEQTEKTENNEIRR